MNMSAQLSIRPLRNNANGSVRSQSRNAINLSSSTTTFQSSGVGGQCQQAFPFAASIHANGFSFTTFDPKFKYFEHSSGVRSVIVIKGKAFRDNILRHVLQFGELPVSAHALESEIAYKKTILIPKKNELVLELPEVEDSLSGFQFLEERVLEATPLERNGAIALKLIANNKISLAAKKDKINRELHEIECGLNGIQYAEEYVLTLKQIAQQGGIAQCTWTTETVKFLARNVDFMNDSLYVIRKKLCLKSIGDLRDIKSKEVLQKLLQLAGEEGLAQNEAFANHMALMKDDGMFASNFSTNIIYCSGEYNKETLVWSAAFYFFLDVRAERINLQLEDKCFRPARGEQHPWIERSNARQVAQGFGGEGL